MYDFDDLLGGKLFIDSFFAFDELGEAETSILDEVDGAIDFDGFAIFEGGGAALEDSLVGDGFDVGKGFDFVGGVV